MDKILPEVPDSEIRQENFQAIQSVATDNDSRILVVPSDSSHNSEANPLEKTARSAPEEQQENTDSVRDTGFSNQKELSEQIPEVDPEDIIPVDNEGLKSNKVIYEKEQQENEPSEELNLEERRQVEEVAEERPQEEAENNLNLDVAVNDHPQTEEKTDHTKQSEFEVIRESEFQSFQPQPNQEQSVSKEDLEEDSSNHEPEVVHQKIALPEKISGIEEEAKEQDIQEPQEILQSAEKAVQNLEQPQEHEEFVDVREESVEPLSPQQPNQTLAQDQQDPLGSSDLKGSKELSPQNSENKNQSIKNQQLDQISDASPIKQDNSESLKETQIPQDEIFMKEAEAWKEKGRVHVIEKNFDQAIECYEKGLENLNPNYFRNSSEQTKVDMFKLQFQMINNLGIVYFSKKDYVQARRFFDATLMQDPNNEKALYNRAKCFNALEEYQKSLEDLKRLVQIKTPSKEIQLFYNETVKKYNQYQKEYKEKAATVYKKMIQSQITEENLKEQENQQKLEEKPEEAPIEEKIENRLLQFSIASPITFACSVAVSFLLKKQFFKDQSNSIANMIIFSSASTICGLLTKSKKWKVLCSIIGVFLELWVFKKKSLKN